MNRTNAMAIAGAYGDETEAWIGKFLILCADKTGFRGKTVRCLRVRIP